MERKLSREVIELGELKASPTYRDSVIIKEKPVGMTRPLMPCELDMIL